MLPDRASKIEVGRQGDRRARLEARRDVGQPLARHGMAQFWREVGQRKREEGVPQHAGVGQGDA